MLLQITLTLLLALAYGLALPWPAHSKNPDAQHAEKVGPKYNYAYKIENDKTTQEKQEQHDGTYALGRYSVQGLESNQNVQYLVDDWGYHPFFEYTQIGPHSKSSAQVAFGEEAIKALHAEQNIKPNAKLNQNEYLLPPPELPSAASNIPPIYAQSVEPHEQNVLYYAPENVGQYLPENFLLVAPVAQPPNLLYPPVFYDQQQKQYQNVLLVNNNHVKQGSNNEHHHTIIDENTLDNNKNETNNAVKDNTAALIEHTRHLINEHDLIEINHELNHNDQKGIQVNHAGETGAITSPSSASTSAPLISASSEEKIYNHNPSAISLSKDPIVVADAIDENGLSGAATNQRENVYSTTQSTVETVNTVTEYKSTNPTVVVTPRPVSTTFLAPITAGVQLQDNDDKLVRPKPTVVVEIQKSVPYYLGKFEFVQNGAVGGNHKKEKSEEAQSNIELGQTLLQYSFESLPAPESLTQQKLPVENKQQTVEYASVTPPAAKPSSDIDFEHLDINNNKNVQSDVNFHLTSGSKRPHTTKNYLTPPPLVTTKYVYKYEKPPQKSEFLPNAQHLLPSKKFPVYVQLHNSPNNKKLQDNVEYTQQVHPSVKYVFKYDKQVQNAPPHHLHTPQKHASSKVPVYVQFPKSMPSLTNVMPLGAYTSNIHAKVPYPVPKYSIYLNQPKVAVQNPYAYAPNYQAQQQQQQCKKTKQELPPTTLNYLPDASALYPQANFNQYVGLKAPKQQQIYDIPVVQQPAIYIPRNRNPRHSFGNIRIEYGFMPPLIPSIEIDEFGKPIEKTEQ